MTSLGKTYERLMKFIRFFENRAPGLQATDSTGTNNESLTANVGGWNTKEHSSVTDLLVSQRGDSR